MKARILYGEDITGISEDDAKKGDIIEVFRLPHPEEAGDGTLEYWDKNGWLYNREWLEIINEPEVNDTYCDTSLDADTSKMVSDFVNQQDYYANGFIESDVFIKHDNSKPSGFYLIPKEALVGMARVLDYGAKKYPPDNWKNCDDINRYKDALWRHMLDWQGGEECDVESKLKHLYHMMCNVAFLIWFEENK